MNLKKMFKMLILAAMLTVQFSGVSPVFAEKIKDVDKIDNYNNLYETIDEEKNISVTANESEKQINYENKSVIDFFEVEMQKNATTLSDEMNKMTKEEYPEDAYSEEVQKAKNQISDYLKYSNRVSTRAIPPVVDTTCISDRAVAEAAKTFFWNKGYKLSHHLLHKSLNGGHNGEYSISDYYKNHLYNTRAIKSLKRHNKYKNGTSTTASFVNKDTNAEADGYYAIHDFNVSLTSNRIKITDRYDFKHEDKCSLQALVVNALVRLQEQGILKTYDIRLHFKR